MRVVAVGVGVAIVVEAAVGAKVARVVAAAGAAAAVAEAAEEKKTRTMLQTRVGHQGTLLIVTTTQQLHEVEVFSKALRLKTFSY
jgi:hypothetical protein